MVPKQKSDYRHILNTGNLLGLYLAAKMSAQAKLLHVCYRATIFKLMIVLKWSWPFGVCCVVAGKGCFITD